MSKPVAFCPINGRGFSKREMQKCVVKGDEILCPCHNEVVSENYPFAKSPSEHIHDMLAIHNEKTEKVFYYTEKEVKELCKTAFLKYPFSDFEFWFDTVKKK